MKRILLTSFEPFDGHPLNSSHEVAKRLVKNPPPGVELDWEVLPVVAWDCVEKVWARAIQRSPEVVLALGQAAGTSALRLEDRAINIHDFPIPDNAGNWPRRQWIIPGGQMAYLGTFPRLRIAARLKEARIPVENSFSAGTYVCNHLYYGLLHRAEESKRPHQTGFIHLPLLPEQVLPKQNTPCLPLEMMVEGVRQAIAECVGL